MISRISSFSGPLAKLFKVQSASLTTSGLILQWEIGESYLGYGTTIEDMTTNNTDGVILKYFTCYIATIIVTTYFV